MELIWLSIICLIGSGIAVRAEEDPEQTTIATTEGQNKQLVVQDVQPAKGTQKAQIAGEVEHQAEDDADPNVIKAYLYELNPISTEYYSDESYEDDPLPEDDLTRPKRLLRRNKLSRCRPQYWGHYKGHYGTYNHGGHYYGTEPSYDHKSGYGSESNEYDSPGYGGAGYGKRKLIQHKMKKLQHLAQKVDHKHQVIAHKFGRGGECENAHEYSGYGGAGDYGSAYETGSGYRTHANYAIGGNQGCGGHYGRGEYAQNGKYVKKLHNQHSRPAGYYGTAIGGHSGYNLVKKFDKPVECRRPEVKKLEKIVQPSHHSQSGTYKCPKAQKLSSAESLESNEHSDEKKAAPVYYPRGFFYIPPREAFHGQKLVYPPQISLNQLQQWPPAAAYQSHQPLQPLFGGGQTPYLSPPPQQPYLRPQVQPFHQPQFQVQPRPQYSIPKVGLYRDSTQADGSHFDGVQDISRKPEERSVNTDVN